MSGSNFLSQAIDRGQFIGLFGKNYSMRIGTLPEVTLSAKSGGKCPSGRRSGFRWNNVALAGNPSFEVRRRGHSVTACNLVSRWSQARSPQWLGNAPLSNWARPPNLQGLDDANRSHSGLRFCQSEDCPILSASSPLLKKEKKTWGYLNALFLIWTYLLPEMVVLSRMIPQIDSWSRICVPVCELLIGTTENFRTLKELNNC